MLWIRDDAFLVLHFRVSVSLPSSIICVLLNDPFSVDVSMNHQVSKEGDTFEVPLKVAKMSELVKTMIDGECFGRYFSAALTG